MLEERARALATRSGRVSGREVVNGEEREVCKTTWPTLKFYPARSKEPTWVRVPTPPSLVLRPSQYLSSIGVSAVISFVGRIYSVMSSIL